MLRQKKPQFFAVEFARASTRLTSRTCQLRALATSEAAGILQGVLGGSGKNVC